MKKQVAIVFFWLLSIVVPIAIAHTIESKTIQQPTFKK